MPEVHSFVERRKKITLISWIIEIAKKTKRKTLYVEFIFGNLRFFRKQIYTAVETFEKGMKYIQG